MLKFLTWLTMMSSLAWFPIIRRFFISWQERRNPVSLAIGGALIYIIYATCVMVGATLYKGDAIWATSAVLGLNIVGCLNFYFCFRWADRKFTSNRNSTDSSKS